MYAVILFINTIGQTKHKLFVLLYCRICKTFGKSTTT